MNIRHYILDEKGTPVAVSLMAWADWFQKDLEQTRRVAISRIGPYKVSTVFLGLDYNYSPTGPPVLWETMVFQKKNPGHDIEMDRCSGSREQAEAMHQKMVELVKEKYGNRNKTKTRKASRP